MKTLYPNSRWDLIACVGTTSNVFIDILIISEIVLVKCAPNSGPFELIGYVPHPAAFTWHIWWYIWAFETYDTLSSYCVLLLEVTSSIHTTMAEIHDYRNPR